MISEEDNTQGVIISLKLTMKIEKNYDNNVSMVCRLWHGHLLSAKSKISEARKKTQWQ